MSEIISTTSTSQATMDVTPIVLKETTTTRLVFFPTWVNQSGNPLRGGFKFQRKGPNDTWINFDSLPLSSLKKNEEYNLNLDGESMSKLFSGLEEVKALLAEHGHSYGTRTFTLSETNANSILLQIGETENREWIIEQLKKLENQNFENLGSVIGRARLENIIEIFEKNLNNNTEVFWESFFEDNPWILQQMFAFPVMYMNGETYLGGKNSKGRQGQGGSATDFLCMNGSNGSFAVVEIKTPDCKLIGSLYRGKGDGKNNDLYSIHGDLSGGVIQMENQMYTAIEYFTTTIGKDYPNLNYLNPAGVLIAGNYSNLTSEEKKSFDLFRKSLGKNQVYTFDEILQKLKLLKTVYEN